MYTITARWWCGVNYVRTPEHFDKALWVACMELFFSLFRSPFQAHSDTQYDVISFSQIIVVTIYGHLSQKGRAGWETVPADFAVAGGRQVDA